MRAGINCFNEKKKLSGKNIRVNKSSGYLVLKHAEVFF